MIPPVFKRFTEANSSAKYGLCEASSFISEYYAGSCLSSTPALIDRFLVSVPYAAQSLSWKIEQLPTQHYAGEARLQSLHQILLSVAGELEDRVIGFVMFDSRFPERRPDFIFTDTLSFDFEPRLEHIPSLLSWDVLDPNALTNVLSELYSEYKHYQVTQLEGCNGRAKDEYKGLVHSGILCQDNIEVNITPSTSGRNSPNVTMIIKLELPFERIPKNLSDIGGKDLAILKVVYNSETSHPTVVLSLTPRLKHVFGEQLQLPTQHADGHLAEYVADLQEYLQERIETLDAGLSKRMAYVEALLFEFKGSMLEFDSVEYATANLLLNFLDFHFIVSISIGKYFPQECPRISLRSIYHSDETDRPFSKTIRSYPWSPRWSSTEMVARLRDHLSEIMPSFQRTSVINGISLPTNNQSEPRVQPAAPPPTDLPNQNDVS